MQIGVGFIASPIQHHSEMLIWHPYWIQKSQLIMVDSACTSSLVQIVCTRLNIFRQSTKVIIDLYRTRDTPMH